MGEGALVRVGEGAWHECTHASWRGMAQMRTLDGWCWGGQLGWLPLRWWGMTGIAAVAVEMVRDRWNEWG